LIAGAFSGLLIKLGDSLVNDVHDRTQSLVLELGTGTGGEAEQSEKHKQQFKKFHNVIVLF
jgi:hypothetical protein